MSADRAASNDAPRIQVSRHFPVPHELVFRAFSSAEHLKQWFAPKGYEVPEARVEFKVGGAFEVCMSSPQGERHWTRGRFVEIFHHERLLIEMQVYDADERPLFRAQTIFRVFPQSGGTRLEVTQIYQDIAPGARGILESAPRGWSETLERLAALLETLKSATAQRSISHGIFTLERFYRAPIERVYQAFTDPAAKAHWFAAAPGSSELRREIDVRAGGREVLHVRWANGVITRFDAVYFDVIPNERLLYVYEMQLDERKISVSLAAIEFSARDHGTRLVVTEQGAFLDGYEDAGSREQGTAGLLDALGRALEA